MTPQELDDRIERLMRIAEVAEGTSGYGVTPNFQGAAYQLIRDCIEAITPEERHLHNYPVDADIGFNTCRNKIVANTKELLG